MTSAPSSPTPTAEDRPQPVRIVDGRPQNMPPLPEWPAIGQRILPGATSYLGRPYRTVLGTRTLTLDLHVPDGGGPFPVATYASGGGFMLTSTVIGEWRALLELGYAVAPIQYRLRDEAKHPEPVGDVAAAVLWLREHAEEFGLRSGAPVGVASSAGAYLTDFAALTLDADGAPWSPGAPNLFRGVVSFYAPTDFAHLPDDDAPEVVEASGTPTSSDTGYLGYRPLDRPDDAAAAALSAHVRADAPPFLLLHGDADTRVGVGQSRRFADALQAVGARHELHIVPGANHGTPEFTSPDVVGIVRDFLASLPA